MAVDLHVHTTASDGTERPEEVVARARRLGLHGLAVTDHDTLDGVAPALAAGRALGIEVLPGVELGTRRDGREVHLLGYLMDTEEAELLDVLRTFREARERRLDEMLARLAALGLPVERRQVQAEAGAGAVGRPHVARVLVKMGAAASLDEAFARYLGEGRPAYVPRLKLSPERAIGLIRRAGGVAVLAHPGLNADDAFISALVDAGLQGLEAYYPEHDPAMTAHYLELCRRYRLVATGGSDFHGPEHRRHGRLAAAAAPDAVLRELRERAGRE